MKKSCIAVVLLAVIVGFLLFKPEVQEAKAVLAGEITWTVEPGAAVEQGSELVRIRSLVGSEIAAARAGGRGVVREVNVTRGQTLVKGQPVAKIEITKK